MVFKPLGKGVIRILFFILAFVVAVAPFSSVVRLFKVVEVGLILVKLFLVLRFPSAQLFVSLKPSPSLALRLKISNLVIKRDLNHWSSL